jgi:uncharacterized membrane protein YhaH (DUF805 family)
MYVIEKFYEIKNSINPETLKWIHIAFDIFLIYIVLLLLWLVFFMGSRGEERYGRKVRRNNFFQRHAGAS